MDRLCLLRSCDRRVGTNLHHRLELRRAHGSEPLFGPPVQGIDGNLYGIADRGDSSDCGTVFRITTGGTLTTLFSFQYDDNGCHPDAGLALADNGDIYGSTTDAGSDGGGTVFRVTPAGALTTIHGFNYALGGNPNTAVLQGTDGNLYGTTVNGGPDGYGSIFKMTLGGTLTELHEFDFTDGWDPKDAPLIQATDGNFYGTTAGGGPFSCPTFPDRGCGTIFKISPGGGFATLRNFDGANGSVPFAGLIQAADGNLYGATTQGGTHGDGTVFKITLGGTLTTLHSFDGTDRSSPFGTLVQATDGNLYGTTNAGGANGDGTIFEITPAGTFTTLHTFDGTDGAGAQSGMLQATNGTLYGNTYGGGSSGNGTVFSLSMGLGPFVTFLPAARPVGGAVQILGQGFTGATAVRFNGIPAAFTFESDTYLTANVPAGATTGSITVSEPGGTLTSNKKFQVTPQITTFSPSAGSAGTTVVITGDSFIGATEVVFECGKAATFTVDSDTQITAPVPAGAMNGAINVVTPGGHVGSAATFTVTP
ncbi:MAG: choice-of-anchor tandem repeat GloVer-containing protein [Candidatus Sulfotelmatobacter sp.]